jgi:HSP20 family protein
MLARQTSNMPFTQMRGEMNRLFEELFDASPLNWLDGRTAFPPLNIWEDDANVHVEAEAPGLKMSDLEVLVMNDELTIKGRREYQEQDKGVAWHRRERGVGTFERSIRLPFDIDAEKVQAALRDGVLTITLPKAASARPRKIEVTGAQ